MKNPSYLLEVPVYNCDHIPGKNGRIDIFDPASGMCWEVKPVTQPISKGMKQLHGYLRGQVDRHGSIRPGAGIVKDNFITHDKSFYVEYWEVPGGIIYYKFRRIYRQESYSSQTHSSTNITTEIMAKIVIGIIIGSLGGIALGGAGVAGGVVLG